MAPRLEVKKEVTTAAKAERSPPRPAAPNAAGATGGRVSASPSAWAGLLEAVTNERRCGTPPHRGSSRSIPTLYSTYRLSLIHAHARTHARTSAHRPSRARTCMEVRPANLHFRKLRLGIGELACVCDLQCKVKFTRCATLVRAASILLTIHSCFYRSARFVVLTLSLQSQCQPLYKTRTVCG
jgi:hypothetical protein